MQKQITKTRRTPQEQIDALDSRLGKGIGAKKERSKLNALMAESSVRQEKKSSKAKKKS